MYSTERRRMSLHEVKRKDPVWVSGGSVWQDSPALELCGAHHKAPLSPRGQNRALSVAYIVIEDASLPHSEENLSLKCLKEACADVRAVFKTISFERISLGTTDVLDSFYNAGKCRHAADPGMLSRQTDRQTARQTARQEEAGAVLVAGSTGATTNKESTIMIQLLLLFLAKLTGMCFI